MFPVVLQTIAATPPLVSLKMAYRNLKTDLTRGASQKKLASEAYRAIGGVARNSIANRATVGHKATTAETLLVFFSGSEASSILYTLSGPDGSRHSSEQDPKSTS